MSAVSVSSANITLPGTAKLRSDCQRALKVSSPLVHWITGFSWAECMRVLAVNGGLDRVNFFRVAVYHLGWFAPQFTPIQ